MVVRGLPLAPMHDSKGEEPHARANRENTHRRAAKWPYIAASLRMKENLVDRGVRTDALHLDRRYLWSNYKSVLQMRQRVRPVKLKDFVFCRRCTNLASMCARTMASRTRPASAAAI